MGFFKKIISLFKLMKNYRKLAVKKTVLIYVYTNPILYFLLSIVAKILIFSKNKILINLFLEKKIFISVIRMLSLKEKLYVANNLNTYNNLKYNNLLKKNIDDKTLKDYENLKENGYCNLGKIFSDEECENFIKNLDNQVCFNNHVVLQSDGNKIYFNNKNIEEYGKISNYISFLPKTALSFDPIKKFLNDIRINFIIDSYLNFKSTIYHCVTFFNSKSNITHYVHSSHRDYDDWKHLQLTIYWNDIDERNGATIFYKKSHNSNIPKNNKGIPLNGKKGEVYLIDTYGMHAANHVVEGFRYITFIRFAKKFNKLSVVDGFLSTPTDKELNYIYNKDLLNGS
tara:strand:+ start:3 stop:1025 length:1023 start_codon:yes stop_codon:yes gene_type:complete